MTSMTGYAYEEVTEENWVASVEIKSVNSRFLDLSINLPSYLNQLESYFKNKITEKIIRGKVDVYIRIKETDTEAEVIVDEKLAKSYMKAFEKICEASRLGKVDEKTAQASLFNVPGILYSNKNYDMEKYKEMLEPIFDRCLVNFVKDREREGLNMKKDLEAKLSMLENCALFFKEFQPKMEVYFKEQISAKFKEILSDNNFVIDENRIMTETAAMMVKYTINEEIVRLLSHIQAMKKELAENATPGKKIDFICQEMNREVNTIGSKNQFTEVGERVIEAKDALENIREQAKNIE